MKFDNNRVLSHYLIKYGETIRMEQANTPEEACRMAYGHVSIHMRVRNIGRRNPKSYSNKFVQELMESTEGWIVPIVKSKLGIDN